MEFHWADIYAAIHKADSTASKIAAQENVSVNTVSSVIKGTKTSHPVAYAISALIGIPTERLWPGKYLTCPAEYKKLRGQSQRGRLPTQPQALLKAS